MLHLGDSEFARIACVARKEAGLCFAADKRAFVTRRLQHRVRETGAHGFSDYLDIIEDRGLAGREERLRFVSALTTNVTAFFREPHHFHILAQLFEAEARSGPERRPIDVWSVGCSTGEEPLSVAALALARFGSAWSRHVRILATDVDAEALTVAHRRGPDDPLPSAFPAQAAAFLSDAAHHEDLTIADLMRGIVFKRHNLHDALPSRPTFDAILCRNVLIYFDREAAATAQRRLAASLRPGGLLFLGHSERLDPALRDFKLIGATTYRHKTGGF